MTHPSILDGDEASAVAALVANGENMRERAAGFRQSILQDADRGRRLEVDETLGHALELAAHAGLETPTLDYCCRVLRVVSRAATD
jgi:ketopantoate reductase